jgi:hypothetical protein
MLLLLNSGSSPLCGGSFLHHSSTLAAWTLIVLFFRNVEIFKEKNFMKETKESFGMIFWDLLFCYIEFLT